MKISQNSTLSLFNTLRHSMSNLQRQFVDAQVEVSTGKVADAGLSLGSANGRRISMVQDIDRLNTIVDTNRLTKNRLDVSLAAIGNVNDIGQDLIAALTVSVGQGSSGGVTKQAGLTAIDSITGILNTTLNGEAIFGGINSGDAPFETYDTSSAKTALDNAFVTHFGFAKTAPAAAGIDATAMNTFLDTVVTPMFSTPGWQSTFSTASDETITARIGLNQTVEGSVSANDTGFRSVMFAAVIAGEYFSGQLNAEAQSAAAEKALSLIGSSSHELADLQSRTGYLTNRIEQSTNRLQVQVDELTGFSDEMVEVDPYEAATRLNSLITQIETSYTLTGRISQLSLMRYL